MQALNTENTTIAPRPEELEGSFVWIAISHLIDSDYIAQFPIDILVDPETGEAPTNHYWNVPSGAKGLIASALKMTINYAEDPNNGHPWQRHEYDSTRTVCCIDEVMPPEEIPACIIRSLKPHDGFDAKGEPWREPLNTSINRLVALRELKKLLPSPPEHVVPILQEIATAWLNYKNTHEFSLPALSEAPSK